MKASDWIRANWHLITAFAVICVAGGTVQSDVSDLKAKDEQRRVDHDLIVEVRTEQRVMKEDIREIKDAVKEIARDR